MLISFSIMPVSVLLPVVVYVCMRQNITAHVSNVSSVLMPNFAHRGLQRGIM